VNLRQVTDPELKEVVGEANFYSITYRLFKLPGLLETLCEDYGQYAVYKGTIPGHKHAYWLDDHHRFEKGKPAIVCGNTAAMVGENGMCWLAKHFEVTSLHFIKRLNLASCVSHGAHQRPNFAPNEQVEVPYS
jgi:hypothetical protein